MIKKVKLNAKELIDEYIEESPLFAKKMAIQLRKIILEADPGITEDWKWGPNYQYNGNMVCGFGVFQKHINFTFFQGVHLEDKKGLLREGTKNLHNRSIKFINYSDIDAQMLSSYIKEAILIEPEKNEQLIKVLELPEDFEKRLSDANLKDKFEKMPYTHRKEHIIAIIEAKKIETRERRIEKALEMVENYKK